MTHYRPLCANITSSTKPEVHNVPQCCRTTEHSHRQHQQKLQNFS